MPARGEASDTERVQAAIVLTAAGRLADLHDAIALAQIDWRDVLMNAGLANEDWPTRLDDHLGPTTTWPTPICPSVLPLSRRSATRSHVIIGCSVRAVPEWSSSSGGGLSSAGYRAPWSLSPQPGSQASSADSSPLRSRSRTRSS